MRLHRFYIEEELKEGAEVVLENEGLYHQWRNVFRLKPTSQIILFNNSGNEYLSTITTLENKTMTVSVEKEIVTNTESNKKIILVTSIPKKDNFEWVLEKGTEIGVAGFVPVISERTEKKNIDEERSKKIIKESAEQSGRVMLPQLSSVMDLGDFIERFADSTIACDGSGAKNISEFQNKKDLHVLIGPEGGWSDKELELFKNKNIPIVKIGNTVLRAETAAIVAASLLLSL